MRVLLVVFIVISAVIAINKDKLGYIADMMGISWGALAGAFLAPFLYGLYWKRTTVAGVFASFGFGVLIMLANMLFKSYFPALIQSPINCGVVAMIGGLILVPVVSLLTPKQRAEQIDGIFACYNEKITVSAKDSLGE